MIYLISILLFVIPFLIVGLWRSRPVLAFIIAALISFLMPLVTGLIMVLQAMMIYEEDDPELVAGAISEAIVSAVLSMMIWLPILALFQFIVRKLMQKKDADKSDKASTNVFGGNGNFP